MKNYKPALEDIPALYDKNKVTYAPLHECFTDDEKFYELKFKEHLGLPDDFIDQGIVLPSARAFVDTARAHTDLFNARVFCSVPENDSRESPESREERREMLRKMGSGILYSTNVFSDISPWWVGGGHYWLHGLSVMQTVYDADRWPDKPEEDKFKSYSDYAEALDLWRSQSHQSLPIVIRAINPMCVYPDPDYNGRDYVIEAHEKLRINVSTRYPNWSNPKGKKSDEKVDFISFWTPFYRCDLADGEPVLKVKGGVARHNYGFIPYTFINSGLGNLAADMAPEKMYVGILRYIYQTLIAESRAYSIDDIVLKNNAWPWYSIEGDNPNQVTAISQTYGKANRLPSGTKIVDHRPQVPPGELSAHFYKVSGLLRDFAAPRSVMGLSEQGVRSGADRRQITAEAATRFNYGNKAFQAGAANVLIKCAQLFKNVIPGDMRVWSRTPTDEFDMIIDKKKMKEPFNFYVEFAPISEEDEYRRHQDIEQMVTTGIVTKEWARQRISNIDPKSMEYSELKEFIKVQLAPQITQLIQIKGNEFIQKKLLAEGEMPIQTNAPAAAMPPLAAAGAGMPQGNRMNPPIPNIPAPGSAEEINRSMELAAKGIKNKMAPWQGMGGGGSRV